MRRIEREQVVRGIERANPWWKTSAARGVGEFHSYPKRSHFDRLHSLILQKAPVRALVLHGPRRVGKTVILYQLIDRLIADGVSPNQILYLSLDNPIFRFDQLQDLFLWGLEWAGASPEGAYIFFDEIQYLDDWEQQLKVLVDTYRETKFVVTGSAAAALQKKSRESGAGRFTTYLMPALSFYEYILIKGASEKTSPGSVDILKMNSLYLEYLNYGGFPESIFSQAMRDQPDIYIGQDILDKVLGRDLPSAYEINNPNELHRLFAALAFNTSQEISPDNLSKQAGVAKKDINKFISFFEAANLIRRIEKTDQSLKKFQRVTHFKVVLTNPSLRSAIFGKVSEDSPELEPLAETAVFSQLVVPLGTYSPYKYARWSHGNSKGEVDLINVSQRDDALGALEIKWTDRFASGKESPKSLISFCKENDLQVALMTSKSIFAVGSYGDVKVYHYPTAFLCFVIGMMNAALEQVRFVVQELQIDLSTEADDKEMNEKFGRGVAASFQGLIYLNPELATEIVKAIPVVGSSILKPDKPQPQRNEKNR